MGGGNRKVNITVTEYDFGDKVLTTKAVMLWQSCTIDPFLEYQLAMPLLKELYHNVILTVLYSVFIFRAIFRYRALTEEHIQTCTYTFTNYFLAA